MSMVTGVLVIAFLLLLAASLQQQVVVGEAEESLSATLPLVQWPSLGTHWPRHTVGSSVPTHHRHALHSALHAHNYSLSLEALERGVAYKGHTAALRRLFDKLLNREPVTVQALGGSITSGMSLNIRNGEQTYVAHTCSWLRRAFPGAAVKCINAGAPGTQSELLSVCLGKWLTEDVDLVTIEFSVNDGYTSGPPDNDITRAYERLLRKLLSLRTAATGHPPALMLVHSLPTGLWGDGTYWNPRVPEKPYVWSSHQYWANAESNYDILAQYYNLPSVSMRDALWELISDEAGPAEGFRRADFMSVDLRHPVGLGHKYTADAIVWALQQALLDWAMAAARQASRAEALQRGETAAAAGRWAEAPDGLGWRTAMHAGAVATATGDGTSPGSVEQPPPRPLPRPLFEHNEVDLNMLCVVGEGLPSLRVPSSALGPAQPPPAGVPGMIDGADTGAAGPGAGAAPPSGSPVTSNAEGLEALGAEESDDAGWQWTDEGRGKWGYVSNTTGARLHLQMDTTVYSASGASTEEKGPAGSSSARPPGEEEKVNVHVFFLRSYDTVMGVASVRCANCQCQEQTLQGLDHTVTYSQCVSQTVAVTQHPRCVVSITVGPRNAYGSSKVKVCGLVTTRDTSQYYQVGAATAARADDIEVKESTGDGEDYEEEYPQ